MSTKKSRVRGRKRKNTELQDQINEGAEKDVQKLSKPKNADGLTSDKVVPKFRKHSLSQKKINKPTEIPEKCAEDAKQDDIDNNVSEHLANDGEVQCNKESTVSDNDVAVLMASSGDKNTEAPHVKEEASQSEHNIIVETNATVLIPEAKDVNGNENSNEPKLCTQIENLNCDEICDATSPVLPTSLSQSHAAIISLRTEISASDPAPSDDSLEINPVDLFTSSKVDIETPGADQDADIFSNFTQPFNVVMARKSELAHENENSCENVTDTISGTDKNLNEEINRTDSDNDSPNEDVKLNPKKESSPTDQQTAEKLSTSGKSLLDAEVQHGVNVAAVGEQTGVDEASTSTDCVEETADHADEVAEMSDYEMTDSQMCEFTDDMMEPVTNKQPLLTEPLVRVPKPAPPKPIMSRSVSARSVSVPPPQSAEGNTIVKALVQEMSSLNKLLIKAKRDIENMKRKRQQKLSVTGSGQSTMMQPPPCRSGQRANWTKR